MTKEQLLTIYNKLANIDITLQDRFSADDQGLKDYLIILAGRQIVEVMETLVNTEK